MKILWSLYVLAALCFWKGSSGFAVTASTSKCGDYHFPCDNGDCVAKIKWCDFIADCADESDETFCAKVSYGFFSSSDPNGCRSDHFHCYDGPCIPKEGKCDGIISCDDFSDEDDCGVILDVKTTAEVKSPTTETSVATKSISTDSSGTVATKDIKELQPETKSETEILQTHEPRVVTDIPKDDGLQPHVPRMVTDIPVSDGLQPHEPRMVTDIPKSNQNSLQPRMKDSEPGSEILIHEFGEAKNEIFPPLDHRMDFELKELSEISEELRFLKLQLRFLNHTLQESKIETPDQMNSLEPSERLQSSLDMSKRLLDSRQIAERWLVEQRYTDWGWGDETPRVVVALQLSNPQFFVENTKDAQLISKELQLQLSTDLLRNQSQVMSLGQLSLYINALLATCNNPKNFHGMNLVEILRQRTDNALVAEEFINPLVYLTLCIADMTSFEDVDKLHELVFTKNQLLKRLDIQALALLAVACVAKMPQYSIAKLQNEAVNRLLYEHPNGTFGNIYSTALMVQALTATNVDNWNRRNSMDILLQRQQEDGSFGDILATYYILPSLAGRSLVSLKETCPNIPENGLIPLDVLKNNKRDRIYVQLSLYLKNPVEVKNTLQVKVAANTTLFDVMRLAGERNQFFRFKYEETASGTNVYSIGGIPNDAERGIYWILQSNNEHPEETNFKLSLYKQDIRQLIPKDGERYIFWYKQIV